MFIYPFLIHDLSKPFHICDKQTVYFTLLIFQYQAILNSTNPIDVILQIVYPLKVRAKKQIHMHVLHKLHV